MAGIQKPLITKTIVVVVTILAIVNCKPTSTTAKALIRVHRLRQVTNEPADLTKAPRCPRAFDYNCDGNGPSSYEVNCETNADCDFKQYGDMCCALPCSNVGCVAFLDLVRVACRGEGDELFLPGDEYIHDCQTCTCGPDGRGICSPAPDCYTVQKNLIDGIMDRQNSPPEGTPEPSEEKKMIQDMLEADKTVREKVVEANRLDLEKIFN